MHIDNISLQSYLRKITRKRNLSAKISICDLTESMYMKFMKKKIEKTAHFWCAINLLFFEWLALKLFGRPSKLFPTTELQNCSQASAMLQD